MKLPFKKPRTKTAPHPEEPALPPGYIVVHYGPNRAMRRAAEKYRRALYRKHETWVRSLIRAGVDVEKVLAQREKKLKEALHVASTAGGDSNAAPDDRRAARAAGGE